MKIRKLILVPCVVILYYLVSIMGAGCAQIGMPTGGVKDTIPPLLLKSSPPNRTLHFSGNHIVFTFDEYVHLQDLQKYLLISPVPKIIPNINSKLKTVSIKIRDTLQPNTTYSFQLGDAIQDINENNPIHNFTYVFSTGSYIDSLEFNGTVSIAETGKPDSTLLVFLYKNLSDSAVYKEKPRYITRVDSAGRYKFKNLAEGDYNLFALKDESGQRMYNNKSQLFAFADSVVHISKIIHPVALYAFEEEKNVKAPSTSSSENKKDKEKILKFNSSVSSKVQDLLSPLSVTFAVPLKNFDSTKIKLTDTLFHSLPATISIDTLYKEITVKNTWTEDTEYKLIIGSDFAEDTMGYKLNKPDTLSFKTKREREYGSIKLNFSNLQKVKNPVLQFVKNNEVVYSHAITSRSFSQKLFEPGEYEIRILSDENQNGVWDTGNYHLRKQPERVISIPKKVSIRADWDNETDISL